MASSEADALAEGWYAPLGESLSQGDIVGVVPHGLIDEPLTICQPHNTAPHGKSNYWPYAHVPRRRNVEFIHARGAVGLGLVVWPDCQVDKLKNQGRPESEWFVGVAPVHPLSKITDARVRDKVTGLNRAQFFPLPPRPPEIPEVSYVDLRYIWPVRHALLPDRRIALSSEARNALAFHLFWFQTEVRVTNSVPCPHCGEQVDASAFFQFKDDGEAG